MPELHNDEPTLEDCLERTSLVKEIGDQIAQCTPPSVIGIHGDWGAGKTSFLHLLHLYLAGACPQAQKDKLPHTQRCERYWGKAWRAADHTAVIWFEAWRYQYETAPIVALLHEIRSQLPLASSLFDKGKKLFEISVRSALMSVESLTKMIGVQASKVQEVGERWEKDNLAEKLPSNSVRDFLNDALTKVLPEADSDKPTPRLIVLIDDLDRCEPESAFKLLEGIKIYLNLPSCVFVFGMNQNIIEAGIEKQLSKDRLGDAPLRARDVSWLGKWVE